MLTMLINSPCYVQYQFDRFIKKIRLKERFVRELGITTLSLKHQSFSVAKTTFLNFPWLSRRIKCMRSTIFAATPTTIDTIFNFSHNQSVQWVVLLHYCEKHTCVKHFLVTNGFEKHMLDGSAHTFSTKSLKSSLTRWLNRCKTLIIQYANQLKGTKSSDFNHFAQESNA